MSTQEVDTLNLSDLRKFFMEKNRDGLCGEFLRVLEIFREKACLHERTPEVVSCLNYLLNAFFLFLLQDDVKLTRNEAYSFIAMNTLIQNLVRISDLESTDFPLILLSGKEGNVGKILTLYGGYSGVSIDPRQLLELDQEMAIVWIYIVLCDPSNINPSQYQKKMQLLEMLDEKTHLLFGGLELSAMYFGVSYLDVSKEALIKNKINALYREENPPKLALSSKGATKKRIGIASIKWGRGTAVYKSLYRSVETLFGDFELVLITRSLPTVELDTHGFDDVIIVPENVLIEDYIPQIRERKLDIIFYPDVGMMRDSIVLSNKRLAPIQICSYGHPVSTYSDQIDYWFGGQRVEHPIHAKEQYTERLILLPGLGIQSVVPQYIPQNPKKSDKFIVACSWGAMKVIPSLVQSLNRILARAQKPILFRFFPNWCINQNNGFLAWQRDAEDLLGNSNVDVIQNANYPFYMQKLEEVDIAIDSYPFGGFNTITDALYLQKPAVAFEGDRAFNRFAAAVLRLMGMDELIATSWETYEDLIVRLINDDDFRASMRAKITPEKFHTMIEKSTDPKAFRRAIDYLIENHEQLQQGLSREPIIIN